MEFSPFNPTVQLCLRGMEQEGKGQAAEARQLFSEAWQQARNAQEKFLAAYYLSRTQGSAGDELEWLTTALHLAVDINDDSVKSALPVLYERLARCFATLGDTENASKNATLASTYHHQPSDQGPFYHGTKADLKTGDLLTAGGNSNYQSELKMNHIYFTAMVNGAGLAAALARGNGRERVYVVETTGPFENDPNVTNKKFPGNPTRSYRSEAPLRIIGEANDWVRPTAAELQRFREKLENNNGEIIN